MGGVNDDPDFLSEDRLRWLIDQSIAGGELARIAPGPLPCKAKGNSDVVLLPLTGTGMSGALLIRSSVVCRLFEWLFETAWRQAIPYGQGQQRQMSHRERVLLTQHVQGRIDQAVADALGLHVRTVSETWRAMLQHYDCPSRSMLCLRVGMGEHPEFGDISWIHNRPG